MLSNQDPTLAIHEKPSARSKSNRQPSTREVAFSSPTNELPTMAGTNEKMPNGDVESSGSKKKNIVAGEHEGNGSSIAESNLFGFGQRIQERNLLKVNIYLLKISLRTLVESISSFIISNFYLLRLV